MLIAESALCLTVVILFQSLNSIPNLFLLPPTAMQLFFRQQAIIAGAIAISYLIASCGPSRILQCNQLITVINKGNTLIDAKKDRYDVASHNQLAQELHATANELEIVEVEDKNLQEYQSRFVRGFRELSQSFMEMGKALEAGEKVETSIVGRKKLQEAKVQLTKAGEIAYKTAEREDLSLEDLQNYCQSK